MYVVDLVMIILVNCWCVGSVLLCLMFMIMVLLVFSLVVMWI